MKSPRSVLIVEDLSTDAELNMREVCGVWPDCRFRCVETRKDFIEALSKFEPDIILCDFKLPGFDGLSALALSKDLAPDTPIIIVTGSMDEDTAVDCMKAGAWDYVIKEHLRRLGPAVLNAWEQKQLRLDQKAAMEKALRWERVFEKAQFGLAHADIRTDCFIEVNSTFARERGYLPEQLRGQPVIEVYAPGERARITRILKDLKKEHHLVFESEHQRRDGSIFPVLMEITVITDDQGYPVSQVAYALDITQRKQTDIRLHKMQTLLNETQQLARMGGWEYEPDTGKVTWTDEVYRIYGVSKEEYDPGNTEAAIAFFVPADREKASKAFYAALNHGTAYELELRLKTAQGKLKWIRTSGQAEIKAGEIARVYGNIIDITAHKAAEAERDRLTAAINQTGESILITDTNGKIQYANPAVETHSGYSCKAVIGKTPQIFKSGEHDTTFYKNLWGTISSGKTWSGRIINKRKDGTVYTEAATISPVKDQAGDIIHYIAVKRDITEHLNLEAQFQQAQKMESVGRLAGGVAHDFNNILSVVTGYSQLALERVDQSTPLAEDLMEILGAAGRSKEIIRQLLAFARKQTITPEIIDLNESIEGMLKILRRMIGEEIELVWHPGSSLRPVKIDPSQLDQILANLCVNARDAIAGVGTITIATKTVTLDKRFCYGNPEAAPGDYLRMTVTDNGSGMDKTTLENIFEPFFTTKESGKGTGLGLSTVYGIVKQNKGFILVESEPDKGTSFRIYLPRYEGLADEVDEEKETAHCMGNGQWILLVEDEVSMLKLTQRMLKRLRYNVLSAETPSEAIRLAELNKSRINLLLTDVVMPEMNGRDLALKVKTIVPRVQSLYMSGYTADVITHRGVLDEGAHFIHKPFDFVEFSIAVYRVLNPDKP